MTINDDFRHVLESGISGALYGIKIRFPHALVMTFLFRSDLSAVEKLRKALSIMMEHSRRLGTFAFTYKVRPNIVGF